MSRKVYTRVGNAWVRHWDTAHVEVYSDDGGKLLGLIKPAGEHFVAVTPDDAEVVLGYAISREVAVEVILVEGDARKLVSP